MVDVMTREPVPSLATTARRRLVDGRDGDTLAPVPTDDSFLERDYLDGGPLEAILEALIAAFPEFAHLQDASVGVLWKRKASKKGGKVGGGTCQRVSGVLGYFTAHEFLVAIAADYARDRALTAWQLEALVYHELDHIVADPESGKLGLRGHDFEGFRSELARYGTWHTDLSAAGRVFAQLGLPLDAA